MALDLVMEVIVVYQHGASWRLQIQKVVRAKTNFIADNRNTLHSTRSRIIPQVYILAVLIPQARLTQEIALNQYRLNSAILDTPTKIDQTTTAIDDSVVQDSQALSRPYPDEAMATIRARVAVNRKALNRDVVVLNRDDLLTATIATGWVLDDGLSGWVTSVGHIIGSRVDASAIGAWGKAYLVARPGSPERLGSATRVCRSARIP
jgi:hypothetical protein